MNRLTRNNAVRRCVASIGRYLATIFAVASFAASAQIPIVHINSDVAITFSASPNHNLKPGDQIDFTIAATNNGPDVVTLLPLFSSNFYDQFRLSNAHADCLMGFLVADDGTPFSYIYDWVISNEAPLHVGETRACHLRLELTDEAPSLYAFSFSLLEGYVDLTPDNNSQTVLLQKAATPVPTLSPWVLTLLVIGFAIIGTTARAHWRWAGFGTTASRTRRTDAAWMAKMAFLSISALVCRNADAEPRIVHINSDVAITFTASPNHGLRPGDLIEFTITATNNGPDLVTALPLFSSNFYDQFDLTQAYADCLLGFLVADDGTPFSYIYDWIITSEAPLKVGETRSCHLRLQLADQAPSFYAFSFGLLETYSDLTPDNNSQTVVLQRAATPVPTLSPPALPAMSLLLAAIGTAMLLRRHRRGEASPHRMYFSGYAVLDSAVTRAAETA